MGVVEQFREDQSDVPLTEDWLRETGFKWGQLERQPSKHWMLWLGQSQAARCGFGRSTDDLGVEVAFNEREGWWFCWLRSDLAGRYSRFIFARDIVTIGDLVKLIEALTVGAWDPSRVKYGSYWTPEMAERHRMEEDRLDKQIARLYRDESAAHEEET